MNNKTKTRIDLWRLYESIAENAKRLNMTESATYKFAKSHNLSFHHSEFSAFRKISYCDTPVKRLSVNAPEMQKSIWDDVSVLV